MVAEFETSYSGTTSPGLRMLTSLRGVHRACLIMSNNGAMPEWAGVCRADADT